MKCFALTCLNSIEVRNETDTEYCNSWFTYYHGSRTYMVKAKGVKGQYDITVSILDATKDNVDNEKDYKVLVEYSDVEDVITSTKMTKDVNTVLLKIKSVDEHFYIYIADCIYGFKTSTEILEYYSPIGKRYMSYPIAVTKDNVYFLLHNTYMSKSYFPPGYNWEEAYGVYNIFFHIDSSVIKPMHVNNIQNRLFNVYI